MPADLKRWQARIEVGEEVNWEDMYHTTYVYGETIDQLQGAASFFLLNFNEGTSMSGIMSPRERRMMPRERRLTFFGNGGDHIVGRKTYSYSFEMEDEEESKEKRLKAGWWYKEERLVRGQVQESFFGSPQRMNSFEDAVDHFVAFALIPEKGPDYHSRALVGNNLRLPLLEKILRETEEHPINDLIQRGWHIVALEYRGELSMTGELMNRKAIFVMGHPEANVALLTLNGEHYQK